MTRTEAIEILRNESPDCKNPKWHTEEERTEAYKMAINSLKAEDADEFIPKSVIEDIKAEIWSIQPKWHENAGKHNCIDEVIKIIEKHISRKEKE